MNAVAGAFELSRNLNQTALNLIGSHQAGTIRIGIVGGGPGGLMTAYLLQQKLARSVDITIWEADRRLGGKINTAKFDAAPVSYEVGAAEFYDYSPIGDDSLKELIGNLGLAFVPMGGNSVEVDGKLLSNLDDVAHHFGTKSRKELERFYSLANGLISPSEFYASQSEEAPPLVAGAQRFDQFLKQIPDPDVQYYVETLIHSDLATEAQHTNVTYGLHNYLMNDARYMQLYGIVGGNEQLISALAASINADVRLESKVRRIRKTPTQKMEIEVEVRCSNAAITVQRHAYDYLVLALPLDHSKKIDFGGSVLSEAIKQHFQHFDHPAHYLRISILFERPFWNGILADSFCMLEAFGGCCLYDESSRCPESKWGVLGWLLGGDAALQMAELTDQELLEAALGSLPDELAFGRRLLVEGKVHRWIGAVNAMPGGQHILPLDCRHVPEPQFHSNFFVVGDYLFDSTVNGVLESANYVSDWISSTVNG